MKAEPPVPPRKRTVADEVRPLLDQIVDDDWYAVAVYPTGAGAAIAKRRCVNEFGEEKFEWRSGAAPDDEGRSAIYVRKL